MDPKECQHCGITWVGDEIPSEADREGRHWVINVVLVLVDDKYGHERPDHYRCTNCNEITPMTIWNHGYKPEFLARVLMDEMEAQSKNT